MCVKPWCRKEMERTHQRARQSAFYIDYIYICSILADFYSKAPEHIAWLACEFGLQRDDGEPLLNNYKRNKWKSRLQWRNCEWSPLSEKQSLSDKVHNNNNNKFKNACNEVYWANIFSMLPRPGCLQVRYLISGVISCLRRPTGLLLSVIMKCCMWQGRIKWE